MKMNKWVTGIAFILVGIAIVIGIIMKPTSSEMIFYSQNDYDEIGIEEDRVEAWEDGMRTNGMENTFEWWYTDAEFEDGTTIVSVFYTKNGFDVVGPAHPKATLEITYPDGEKDFYEIYEEKGTILNASKRICDVRIKDAYLVYKEGHYVLHFENEELTYHAEMTSKLPMWRPGTGHTFYGDEREHYFAWVVGQPASEISATLTVGQETTILEGRGYHDHNWGNIEMNKIVDHWYWGRAQIDDYTLITSDLVTSEKYGQYRLPVMLLAKDGEIIDVDIEKIQVERKDYEEHSETGKFMDNHLIIRYPGKDGTLYTIEYIREKDLLVSSLLDNLPQSKKILAEIVGANPTYVRIVGDVILTIEDESTVEVHKGEGLWEQMSFGNTSTVTIHEYDGSNN